jgi:hypothetical protein
MSKDEPESLPPAGAAPGSSPEPAGPASPRPDATLREQVIGVIHDILADTCPEGAWARRQLQELLAAHPGEPERALLEHLILTRRRTAGS